MELIIGKVYKYNFLCLEKCFQKSMKQVLGIYVSRHDSVTNQFFRLDGIKILPLCMRFFQRYCTLVFRIFNRRNVQYLISKVRECDKAVRHPFLQPVNHSKYGQIAFSNIAPKLLNIDIFPKHISNDLLLENRVKNEKKFLKDFKRKMIYIYQKYVKFFR